MIKKIGMLSTVVGGLFILILKGKLKSVSNSSSCNSTVENGQMIESLKSRPMTGKGLGSSSAGTAGPSICIGSVGHTNMNGKLGNCIGSTGHTNINRKLGNRTR
ncbi:hypothetical protein KQ41_06755 [Lysinibacillus fusiformis]|uniref:hypothetical protein n=1 Tax=Lysinibacillus fusiformis TaxID=28031 RepID=UPI0005042ED8|nr:hypothetical protein [Lysinibacillus fusiformis]KGA83732.1 hypothetical protein KQ41_06755 [Lysinibacillus fusiformis]